MSATRPGAPVGSRRWRGLCGTAAPGPEVHGESMLTVKL